MEKKIEEIAAEHAPIDTQDNPAYPNHTDTDIFVAGFKAGVKYSQEDYDKLKKQADEMFETLRWLLTQHLELRTRDVVGQALTNYENSKNQDHEKTIEQNPEQW